MDMKVKCPRCDGKGWYRDPTDPPTRRTYCNMCERKGEILLVPGSEICDRCGGKGMLWSGTSGRGCDKCLGKGIVKVEQLKSY